MPGDLLAHSGRKAKGIEPQPYLEHVSAVRRLAGVNLEAALRYHKLPAADSYVAIEWASLFHDLGKLEPANQAVLATEERGRLPVNHVDAGVAHLFGEGQWEAALIAYCHHIGLCDLPKEYAKHQRSGQNPALAFCRDEPIKLRTDSVLPEMLRRHQEDVRDAPSPAREGRLHFDGLTRRLLLSCLVDGDHSDTARHYQKEADREPAQPRWRERLQALDTYVEGLGCSGDRDVVRGQIYRACRSASPETPVWACDSPVGSGKTTAVMAYLLRAAIDLDLRHIFVVLPYTNIVDQSVETYRRALVLPGEDPKRVVAAHHHQAEFETRDLRYLTTLWDSPVIVTTAVQFFETLGANQTQRLRKLHRLPGSAVFVDEAHAAMPVHLWPFMWDNVKALATLWTCRFVLASGSLARFWENLRILGDKVEQIPSMVPEDLRVAASAYENSRVRYESRPGALALTELCDWIQGYRRSRLVVINTVQSAAVLARELRSRGVDTLHLSTALAPVHRGPILREVASRLKAQRDRDWVLVATSCVESGVDLSFATGFRERCRATSLVQTGGRVNRHGEQKEGLVWDFVTGDPLLTQHPEFRHGRDVVACMFEKAMWGQNVTDLMTYALREEFKRYSSEGRIATLSRKEKTGDYPSVAKLTQLINADTRLVVIDADLAAAVEAGEPVDPKVLVEHSVQLWARKVEKLALRQIGFKGDLYCWTYDYDRAFLGIMEGLLGQDEINRQGYAII